MDSTLQSSPTAPLGQAKPTRKEYNTIYLKFRMLGNEDNPGIMLLTLQELFSKINSNSIVREYSVKLWYIEIYNENIRDLLSNSDEYLDLREDHNKGVIVNGVTELAVNSAQEVITTLK